MLDYKDFIYDTHAYKNVVIDFEKERIAHTYLLENKDMNLCLSFAKILSSLIVKGKNTDKAFLTKLEKNIHPDIKIYGLEKKIMVDNATEIVSDVFVMPFEEDRKVYILLDSGSMNNETQNKLLKTLEEPPKSSYFILCAKNDKSLLQTIISRSKKIVIEDPSNEQIYKMLIRNDMPEDKAKIVSVCACGDASKAENMIENVHFIKLYNDVFDMFRLMNSSKDILSFVSRFSSKDFSALDFLSIVETIAMDIIYVLAKTEQLINNKHKINELKMISSLFTVNALTKILQECFDFRESLYYNVSVTPALDQFLLKFVEVKVKCKR